jgi:predicted adenine nucleotide alpha hydrolase (AANH) superfamily ATPase
MPRDRPMSGTYISNYCISIAVFFYRVNTLLEKEYVIKVEENSAIRTIKN